MGHVTWGVVVACGKGEQLTEEADIGFLSLGSRPALAYSLLAFERCPDVEGVVVVARKERLESVVGLVHMFGTTKVRKVVAGAPSRRGCLLNALKVLDEDVSVLALHEASRPCVPPELISETIKSAKRYGCGVAAARLHETVKAVQKGLKVTSSVHAGKLWVIQKPQSYKRELLEKALAAAGRKRLTLEDESDALELIKKPVHLVPSSPGNMRVHGTDDLTVVSALLQQVPV